MYEMKESGIEWIGQIPKHWEVRKNKYLLKSVYSGGTPLTSVADFYSDNEGINFVTIADMSNTEFVESTIKLITAKGCAQKKLKILNKGTILFSIYATIGAVAELKIPATINQAILALEPYNIYKEYYKYNLKAMNKYLLTFVSTNTQGNLNLEKVLNLFINFPPLDEQKKIADFLDNKVTEIDNLIDDTKKLIDKYKEYKQSLITETVTKGLHSNVEMKDSGIEWIREIPKHWKVSRLKYLCDVRKRKNTQNIIMRYIGLENIESYTGKYKTTNSEYSLIDAIICQTNDIIFGKLRPYLSKTYIVDEISCCSSEFIVLYNVDNVKFIFFLLLSNGFIDSMSQIAYGAKMPRVSDEDILNFYLPLPPLDEQEEIVKYLDDKCSQIDSIIEEKQSLIEKLEEYKKSLIYEYVTGKKQV